MQLVAVIIPTYRPGTYFYECLNALNNQIIGKEYFKVYICLNGDKYPYILEVIKILKNVNFDYEFIYTTQVGVSNARNILLKISQEKYITFIDDDDIVSKNYLQELLQVTSINVMGISSVANFLVDTEKLSNNYIGTAFHVLHPIETSKFKSRKFFSSPWGKMLHRDMIGENLFDPNLSKGEDSLFMAVISPRIICVKKTSDGAIYFVRNRPGSATRKKGSLLQDFLGLNYVLFQYIKLLLRIDYDKKFILSRIAATLIKYPKMLKKYIKIN